MIENVEIYEGNVVGYVKNLVLKNYKKDFVHTKIKIAIMNLKENSVFVKLTV